MKTISTLFIMLSVSVVCAAQTVSGTFQGEIEGNSPFIIHINAREGSVGGFYKYLEDSVVVPLRGTLDHEGNLALSSGKKAIPSFTGKLEGKVIEGSFMPTKKGKGHLFYACDLRGEYTNYPYHDYLSISLSEGGYMLKDMNRTDEEALVTTHLDDNGRIYLHCDALNTWIYLHGDTLIADTVKGMPTFIRPSVIEYGDEKFVFTPTEEFYDSGSFVEFPEKDDSTPGCDLFELSGKVSIRLRQIPRSEYIIGKWTRAPAEHYEAITDFKKAEKMLNGRLQFIQGNDTDGEDWSPSGVEITYNDGTKRMACYGGGSIEDYFIEYYPQLDVVVLNNEAGGDEPIDLGDSSNEYKVGNPGNHTTSPDGKLRITGYYPGGAYDTDIWFMEQWNNASKKYEYLTGFECDSDVHPFMLRYISDWVWTGNDTVLCRSYNVGEYYYEMTVILKKY